MPKFDRSVTPQQVRDAVEASADALTDFVEACDPKDSQETLAIVQAFENQLQQQRGPYVSWRESAGAFLDWMAQARPDWEPPADAVAAISNAAERLWEVRDKGGTGAFRDAVRKACDRAFYHVELQRHITS
ncbi:MAG: hypothetical protein IMW91_05590 [Firmicutes bacterium]|nr:hypothetical protein [Bacillota bacterium]